MAEDLTSHAERAARVAAGTVRSPWHREEAAARRLAAAADVRAAAIRAAADRRRCTSCGLGMVVQPAWWHAHMRCRPDLYGPGGTHRDPPKRS